MIVLRYHKISLLGESNCPLINKVLILAHSLINEWRKIIKNFIMQELFYKLFNHPNRIASFWKNWSWYKYQKKDKYQLRADYEFVQSLYIDKSTWRNWRLQQLLQPLKFSLIWNKAHLIIKTKCAKTLNFCDLNTDMCKIHVMLHAPSLFCTYQYGCI